MEYQAFLKYLRCKMQVNTKLSQIVTDLDFQSLYREIQSGFGLATITKKMTFGVVSNNLYAAAPDAEPDADHNVASIMRPPLLKLYETPIFTSETLSNKERFDQNFTFLLLHFTSLSTTGSLGKIVVTFEFDIQQLSAEQLDMLNKNI